MVPPLSRTAEGFELQFGTNHLGHFALTNLLLEHVTGRVVTVSSTGHRIGKIDFDDLNWERKPYRAWRAYGQSKLANLLFTSELQRRLTAAGSPVLATAAHPGYAATNLQFHSERRLWDALSAVGNRVLAQDEDGGALPTLYAATAEIPGNSFAGPGGFMEQRGPAKLVGRSAAAKDTRGGPPPVGRLGGADGRRFPGRGGGRGLGRARARLPGPIGRPDRARGRSGRAMASCSCPGLPARGRRRSRRRRPRRRIRPHRAPAGPRRRLT